MTQPTSWLMVQVTAPSAEHAALLAEGLFAFGAEGLEDRGRQLITYVAIPAEGIPAYVARLRAHLYECVGGSFEVEAEAQPARDWSEEWKRGLGPRRVGERLIVAPSWTRPDAKPGDLVITIDPQMAFGTGEHASTRGALRLLERWQRPGDVAIDVGAGSAVLAIAAARLGASRVLAVEYDPDAVINAEENIDGNQVRSLVTMECALVDDAYLSDAGQFDLILANILSGVIIPLLPAFQRALRPDGRLIAAGILQEEAKTFLEAARTQGFSLREEDREDEWWSALLVPDRPAE